MKPLPVDFTLTSDRLRLRIPEESDIPHVFDASRVPGFNDGMLWDPPANLDELRGPFERAVRGWHEAASYQFTIEADGEFAGRIALRRTNELDVLDIGYWTHPRLQRRGIMKEALRLVVGLGFERMEAEAIVACYAVWNEPSRRVLEAVGFRTVSVVPNGFVKGDRTSDEAHVRLERTAWQRERNDCDSNAGNG